MARVYPEVGFILILLLLCGNSLAEPAPVYFQYETVETRSHGANAFTEGLVFRLNDDLMLESTGLVGKSQRYRLTSSNRMRRRRRLRTLEGSSEKGWPLSRWKILRKKLFARAAYVPAQGRTLP